ncbi:MAG: Rieske 2Fe-2S domain-containing protein [Kofleriaceae bacterium]|nr:Rieske 2Fe-2S domain-containing protein [Kofleriaceae bacterium]
MKSPPEGDPTRPVAPAQGPGAAATPSGSEPEHDLATDAASVSRRKVLAMATVGVGGCLGVGLAVPALRMLAHPAGRAIVTTPREPLDLGSADLVPAGGAPIKLAVIATTVRDAWTSARDVPLGAAWVRRDGDRLFALSATCPHLGCAIGWDDTRGRFACPCHDSAFAVSGERITGPAERGLDPLPIVVEGGRLKLTWMRFRAGIANREPA